MDRSAVLNILGSVPAGRDAARAGDILAALVPPGAGQMAIVKSSPDDKRESATSAALGMLPGLAGGAVGAFMVPKHWLLAFLAGNALVHAAPQIYRGGDERKDGLASLGVVAAGTVGSLWWKNHPFWGWLLGTAAGVVGASFVPGTRASAVSKKYLSK